MIGMSFASFVALFVIGAVCALFFYGMSKTRMLLAPEGYLLDLIAGWIGAWIGTPVVGHWSWMVTETNVYLVPAVVGSLAAIYTLATFVTMVESLRTPISSSERMTAPEGKTRVA
jgi:uncharacterized membrane protein YeaQ/YmgE (transglycosylase-associated protein family)